MEKAKKKIDITTIILIAALVIGLSLILYPTVSDYVNGFSQSTVISTYTKAVSIIEKPQYDKMMSDAEKFNSLMNPSLGARELTEDEIANYESVLNVDGKGAMGYVEIPSIDVSLPIYHGTSEGVLQKGVGHLEWTNLPIGGAGTHSVVSGHRGLPSSKLFTNLDKLETGDVFYINVLEDKLCYEVDQILIVIPSDTSSLNIVDGQDLCTLMTCTPYGINTHRLLVRGHRIENIDGEPVTSKVTSNAGQVNPYLVAFLISVPILLIMLFILIYKDFGKGKNKYSEQVRANDYVKK